MLTMSEPYPLLDSLGYRMTLTSRINERRFDALLAPMGLSRVTWCVLLAVGQQGLETPSQVASWIGIDRTATSRALRRLDKNGHVARNQGTGDKRVTVVSITAAGHEVLRRASDAARENAAHFNAKLTWYEQDMLASILTKLLQNENRAIPDL